MFQILVEHCPADDPDTEINLGCLQFKEGDHDGALKRFNAAQQILGYKPDLAYNIALCHYEMKQYSQALKCTAEIIEKGVKDHPGFVRQGLFRIILILVFKFNFIELNVGMLTDGLELRSVGNTLILHETALIEAFNLKAAIEYSLKNSKFV